MKEFRVERVSEKVDQGMQVFIRDFTRNDNYSSEENTPSFKMKSQRTIALIAAQQRPHANLVTL